MGYQNRNSSDLYNNLYVAPDVIPYDTSYTHHEHGGSPFVRELNTSSLQGMLAKLEEKMKILLLRVAEKRQLREASNVVDSAIDVLTHEVAVLERATSTLSLHGHR